MSSPSLVLELSRVKTRHVDASSQSVELRECGACVPRLLLCLSSVLTHGRPTDLAPVCMYSVWVSEPLRSLADALGYRLGCVQLNNWQLLQNLSGLSVADEGVVRGHFRFAAVNDKLRQLLLRLSGSGLNERAVLGTRAVVFSDGVSVQDSVKCHAYTVVGVVTEAAVRAKCYLYEAEVEGYASAFYSLKVCTDIDIALEPALCWAAAVRQGCDVDILRQHVKVHSRLLLADLQQAAAETFIWDP